MRGKPSPCLRPLLHPSKRAKPTLYPTQQRYNSTKHIPTGDDLGPIHRDTTQHKSFLVRKHGAPNLPLPPSLDPIVISQKNRWIKPKQRPKPADFTAFQKKLRENPYAHILASPPRQCRANNILLPSPLLLPLYPRPHPKTSSLWLLPLTLTSPPTTHHLGPPSRLAAHKFIAQALTKRNQWRRILNVRMIEKLGPKAVANLVWREDLPDLATRLMREKVSQKLKWWLRQQGRLVACKSPWPEHIKDIDNVSTVLYLKSLRTEADEYQARVEEITSESENWVTMMLKGLGNIVDPHKKPGVTHTSPWWFREPVVPRLQPRLRYPELEFKTTMWRGRKVAVYSLVDLLGEDMCRELIEGSAYEGEECLVVRGARHNVALEMDVMALACWLAEPGP